jgi:vitamin B12 transporter
MQQKNLVAAQAAYLLAAFAAATPALADNATAPSQALDPVVVTATRTPVAASSVNAAVTVIGRDQLELLQGGDVADALTQVAGIDVIRNGGPGQSPTAIFIRGAESKHTLVLVDGVRVNDGVNGIAALEDIPLEAIEHIEVVKGPRSSQWGSDAIGGVINIITRQAAPGLGGELAAGYGRYNSSDFSGRASYRNVDGGLALGLERQDTDGYPPFRTATVDASHENLTGSVDGDYRLAGGELFVKHLQAVGQTEYLDSPGATQANSYDFTRRASSLGWRGDLAQNWNTTLVLQLVGDKRTENQVGAYASTANFAKTDRLGVDWQNDVKLGAHALTLGANYTHEDTKASSSDATFNQGTTSKAVFAQDAFAYGRHSLLASARYTDHDSFGGYTTGALDYGFALTPAVTTGIGYGTAFRAPDASERFLSFPAFGFYANPNLKPETSRNLEASVKARLAPMQNLRVSVFQNDIRQLISTETDPVTFDTTYVNVNRARITGLEAEYQAVFGGWSGGINGNLQRARNADTGEHLLRRADKSLSAQLMRHIGPHRIGLDLQAVGGRPDLDFSSYPSVHVNNGGYGLLTLLGEAQLRPKLTLGARVENLLNHDYQTVYGYRQSGIAGYGTLRYRF